MFWNKDRIPNRVLDDDKDLFKMDEDDDSEVIANKILPSTNNKKEKQNKKKQVVKIKEIKEKEPIDKYKLVDKLLTISIIVVCALGFLIITDIMLITRFNVGPVFAIKTYQYNDGGTKVYNGIGYKVIKYNVKDGRRDTVVGGWNIKYSTLPISVDIMDLAIEFNNNIRNATNNYLNKYIEVNGSVSSYENNTVVLKYIDSDKKYTTYLKCNLNSKNNIDENSNITIRGTLYDYDIDKDLTLYIKNCNIVNK